jgi:hypothetical protein
MFSLLFWLLHSQKTTKNAFGAATKIIAYAYTDAGQGLLT